MAANNDALSVMATAYGVKRGSRRNTSQVAKSVKKASVLQHPGMLEDARIESFTQVVGILEANDLEEFERFRSGAPIPELREAMVRMVALYEGDRELTPPETPLQGTVRLSVGTKFPRPRRAG